jgi:ADP-ribose pyrophosphatase
VSSKGPKVQESKGPRRLERSVRFKGRVFRVESDRVRLPNGRQATLDIVRHRGSVVLIPQPAPGRVILIRQYRYAIDRWIWELPAGTLDEGESPRAAAIRECAEEIGLEPRSVEKLGEFYPTPGFCDEVMLFYRCTRLTAPRRPPALDPDEQIEPRTFTIAEVRRLIARRQVIDMKTVVGLALLGKSQT